MQGPPPSPMRVSPSHPPHAYDAPTAAAGEVQELARQPATAEVELQPAAKTVPLELEQDDNGGGGPAASTGVATSMDACDAEPNAEPKDDVEADNVEPKDLPMDRAAQVAPHRSTSPNPIPKPIAYAKPIPTPRSRTRVLPLLLDRAAPGGGARLQPEVPYPWSALSLTLTRS